MVRTGGSYLSHSELPVTFGLQPGEAIERLEIAWPSGAHDVFRGLHINSTFMAREGEAPGPGLMAQQPETLPVPADLVQRKRTAMAHYQAGRFEAARTMFEHVLQAQPADYIAQQYLIELYWRLSSQGKPVLSLPPCARRSPTPIFSLQFAFHLEEARLRSLADLVYHEAAQLDPLAPEAPYRLGKNALRQDATRLPCGIFVRP